MAEKGCLTSVRASVSVNPGRGWHAQPAALDEEYENLLTLFESWMVGRTQRTKQIHLHGARTFLRFVRERWGARPVEGITLEQAQTWVEFLLEESGYSPASIRSFVLGARLLFKALLDLDMGLKGNPFARIRGLPAPRLPDLEFPTDDDVRAMARACDRDKTWAGARDKALLVLLRRCGLRQQELLKMTPDDIDLHRQVIQVKHSKGGIPRVVGLDEQAMPAVVRYLNARSRFLGRLPGYRREGHERVLWLSRRGAALTGVGLIQALRRRAREAKVDEARMHPHALRHLCASSMLEKGLLEGEVKFLLGWSPTSAMIHRYTRHNLEQRALDKMRRLGAGEPLR